MKKVASILLVLLLMSVLFVGVCSFTAAAAKAGDYIYSVTDGEATITNYTGSGGAVTIPSKLGGYPVTSIGIGAFQCCDTITSVKIPNSVKSIGVYAFSSCTNLASITIPDSVKSIGGCAFEGTKYYNNSSRWENKALYIGNHLIAVKTSYSSDTFTVKSGTKTIAGDALNGCTKIRSITIGDSVKSIGAWAFYGCIRLTSITIGDNVTSIGVSAFKGTKYYNDDSSWQNKALYIGNHLIVVKTSYSSDTFTVKSGTKTIADGAFYGCTQIRSTTIPNSVTSVGEEAFKGCTSLASVTIPNSVTSIGRSAFEWCAGLTSVAIPKSVKSIGAFAFYCCNALNTVYYEGAKSDQAKISVGIKNDVFLSANWKYKHYTHTYKTTTTKATFSKNGSIVKKCSVCGDVASKSTIKYVQSVTLSTTSYTYDGNVKTPSVTVKDSAGKTLKKNTDYTVTYASGKKNIGTYKVTIKMKGNYSGTKTLTFKINPKIKLSATSYTYNGKVKTPSVTVTNFTGKKLSTKYYKISYSSGRKNVGKYTVTIKFKNGHSGIYKYTFKINPAKTTVSKLTAGKKSITVAITRKSTQVTGYQIQYSTSKKFTNAKTKTISSYKTTKYTLKSLSAKKTYYVRVRTYKTVNGTKYYSGWSTYKYVKTK